MIARSLAFAAILAAGPAAAEPVVRLCVFDSEQSGGWVQSVVQIAHDAASGEVEVLDGLIAEHTGGPVAGTVQARRDGSSVYHWVVRDYRDAAGSRLSRLRFEVVIQADGTATGRMRPPPGFVGAYSARGRCHAQG